MRWRAGLFVGIAACTLGGLPLAVWAQTVAPAQPDASMPEPELPLVTRLMNEGRQAMQARRLDEAYRIFVEALQADPRQAEALYFLGAIHVQRREYAQGIELMRRSLALVPGNIRLRFSLARALQEAQQVAEAAQQYSDIIAMAPADSIEAREATLNLGTMMLREYGRTGRMQEAIALGQELLAKFPDNPDALFQSALAYLNSGQPEQAEPLFKRLTELVPDNVLGQYYLGAVYEAMRRFDEAERYFSDVVRLAPSLPVAKTAALKLGVLRGIRYLNKGDKALAKKEFQAVIEQEPNNLIANNNLAILHYQAKEYEQAVAVNARLLALYPNNLEIRLRQGLTYLDMSRLFDAVRELDIVARFGGDTPLGQAARDVLARMENSGVRVGMLRQMVADIEKYEQRLRDNPGDAGAHFGMGEVYLVQGKIDLAKTEYEAAVRLDPSHGLAYSRLAGILEEQNKIDEAVVAYGHALAMITDPAEQKMAQKRYGLALARSHAGKREFRKSDEVLKDLLLRYPDDGQVLTSLAIMNAQRGELEEASLWYNKVLEIQPTNYNIHINLAGLYEEQGLEDKALPHYNKVLLESGNERMKAFAARRIDFINRQLGGMSYGVGYGLSFDNNLNMSRDDPIFEYRSDTYGSASYNNKLKRDWKFSMDISGAYSVYHVSQFDFLSINFSPTLIHDRRDVKYSVGLERNKQYGVLREGQSVTTTDSFFIDRGWAGHERFNQVRLSYRGFGSEVNPFFDATTTTLSWQVNARMGAGRPLSYGVSFTNNENVWREGNDYAYNGLGINFRVDDRYSDRLTVYAGGDFTFYYYSNLDSSTGFTRHRMNELVNLRVGGNWRYNDRISFYGNLVTSYQRSNLPVGFIYNQLQSIEGRQSASLGTYQKNLISVGLRMNF